MRPVAADLDVKAVLGWLEVQASAAVRDGMARYAIPSDSAYGVSVGALRRYAKRLGQNHALAGALWRTGRYEARLLATFLAEPARVTPAEMDRWCRDFDSWAVCDTACFHLFDRTPHAFGKIAEWSGRREEFVRRAAFALLASLALHDKRADDDSFRHCLPLIEKAADDDRNFVKKAVSWALRGVGRRNAALNAAALSVARRLSSSAAPAARWVGKDALKDLTGAVVQRRLAKVASKAKTPTKAKAKKPTMTTTTTARHPSRSSKKVPAR
jgi:3-methyladenine DNA glycosylase AlkD